MKSEEIKIKRGHNKSLNFDSGAFASTLLFEQFVFQEYICGLQT
jgi:hypothetical protein